MVSSSCIIKSLQKYTCFNAVLSKHPTLTFSHRVQMSVLYICLFFYFEYRVIVTIFLNSLGRPRGMGWRGRWEGGSGWGIHVNPWLIHVNVWQKPLQYRKVISLQLIQINGKKKVCKSVLSYFSGYLIPRPTINTLVSS